MSRSKTRHERVLASWADNAAAWIETVRGDAIATRQLVTNDAIVAAVVAHAPARVLDVGCGEGWLSRQLAEHGIDVVGVDAVPALIAAARALGGAEYRVADYASLPDDLGEFCAAVCNYSLFDEDLAPCLSGLRSRLVTRGALLIQTVHPDRVDGDAGHGWQLETFSGFATPFPATMPWYRHSESSWRAALGAARFDVASVRATRDPATGTPVSLLLEAVAD